ncbi:MAG: hypothetical protein VX265_06685 [Myxococcota bacterium]|nr:hypothetical protein [Myxococcota bacterium]
MGWWKTLKARWKDMLAEYGSVALGVWMTIFVLVFVSFVVAIELGFEPEGVAGESGKWGMAYVATQLTKPFRIVAVLFLTPVVARVLRHRRADVADADAAGAEASSEDAVDSKS